MHTALCERRDHRFQGQTIPLVALADAETEIEALKTEVDRMRDDRAKEAEMLLESAD